jgi:5'-methylthioadenosine phosphorylase
MAGRARNAPRVGIIGGTGVYDPAMFKNVETVKMTTPYGMPSGAIEVGELAGVPVAFLPRHGKGHIIPPHRVNYRANIWALKELGVERIISPCACGSLNETYKPRDLVIVDQYIDFTKKRDYTFYDGGKTIHVSTAEPFCTELRDIFFSVSETVRIPLHKQGTYICIEGPRFSTRAESRMFRNYADIIGMTLVPECQLARELELCYISLAMVTDYDVWKEKPVNIEEVIRVVRDNTANVQKLLSAVIPKIPESREVCECKDALKNAEV